MFEKFELRIGGLEFYPIPDLVVSNCEFCNKDLYNAIDFFNTTKSIDKLKALTCSCEEEYIREKSNDKSEYTLDERINQTMNFLLREIIK